MAENGSYFLEHLYFCSDKSEHIMVSPKNRTVGLPSTSNRPRSIFFGQYQSAISISTNLAGTLVVVDPTKTHCPKQIFGPQFEIDKLTLISHHWLDMGMLFPWSVAWERKLSKFLFFSFDVCHTLTGKIGSVPSCNSHPLSFTKWQK